MILQHKTLSSIGFSNYILTIDGKLYKTRPILKEMKKDRLNRFYLIDDAGNEKRIQLKELYRKAYHKEFCVDNTTSFPLEIWKEIENTDGKYLVSNYGRVKSLCGYNAIILKEYRKQSGYLVVKINGKNQRVHRLVAFAFCENKYTNQKTEIHHKDGNKVNNKAENLEILSIPEHHKRHSKKEKTYNE